MTVTNGKSCNTHIFSKAPGHLNGTESVISREPPSKDDNAQFPTVPFKALSYQVWIIFQGFFLKLWLLHYFSDKGFKGTIVNGVIAIFALRGSLEITLTLSLM